MLINYKEQCFLSSNHRNIESEKPTILVVDDEESNRKVLTTLLSPIAKIVLAKNGEQALGLARSQRPNLMLLDIMMPTMDGYSVLEQLKQNVATCHIEVMFVTGRDSSEDELRAFKLGASDYIRKPFRGDIVQARVKAAINKLMMVTQTNGSEMRTNGLEISHSVDYLLASVEFIICIDQDEEMASIQMEFNGRTYDLGARVHHYLISLLVRYRAIDHDNEEDEYTHGWRDKSRIVKDIGLSESEINIQIFRFRKQLLTVTNNKAFAEKIIDRRRNGNRQIRFAGKCYKIYKSNVLEYGSKEVSSI